jgi:hypothetical protein
MVMAVASYRVSSVPVVDPGFTPSAYLAEITPESIETAEMYRRANDEYVSLDERLMRVLHLTERNREWLDENAECLATLLEASDRPSCTLDDPRPGHRPIVLHNNQQLIDLITTSAVAMQRDGKIDEAFDRLLVAFRVISHWGDHVATRIDSGQQVWHTMAIWRELYLWGTRKGQTLEHIQRGLDKLRTVSDGVLRLEDGIESNYLLARYFLLGEIDADAFNLGGDRRGSVQQNAAQMLWLTLLPWEDARELRMQKVIAKEALANLRDIRFRLDNGEAVGYRLPANEYRYWDIRQFLHVGLDNTYWGYVATERLVQFEQQRRVTMLQLALEGFRLEHGKLPATLSELVGPYFTALPLDPYAAKEFLYFPHGIPEPRTPLEAADLAEARRRNSQLVPGKPGLWSSGSKLRVRQLYVYPDLAEGLSLADRDRPIYYVARDGSDGGGSLPLYNALVLGNWYPLHE